MTSASTTEAEANQAPACNRFPLEAPSRNLRPHPTSGYRARVKPHTHYVPRTSRDRHGSRCDRNRTSVSSEKWPYPWWQPPSPRNPPKINALTEFAHPTGRRLRPEAAPLRPGPGRNARPHGVRWITWERVSHGVPEEDALLLAEKSGTKLSSRTSPGISLDGSRPPRCRTPRSRRLLP